MKIVVSLIPHKYLKFIGGLNKDFGKSLTIEQVKVYADPKFDDDQMFQIRKGLEEGLTIKQIKVFAKPEFDCCQMEEIREGFKNGLSME